MALIAFAIIFAASLHYQGIIANRQLAAGGSVSPLMDHIAAVIIGMTIVLPVWTFSYFILGNGGAP